ncbi:MAG: serine protease [Candidatus Baltobacteraceae bacterium]
MTVRPRFDWSALFAAAALLCLVAAGVHLLRMLPSAERGLVVFAQQQKDMFVDARLVRAAYRASAGSALERKLRGLTVIVATRTSPATAYMGAGVVLAVAAHRIEILTAKHLVTHRGRKFVLFADRTFRRPEKIVLSRSRDLALVYVDATALPPHARAHLAVAGFSSGDRFVVMGHPGARSWTASPGVAEHHLHETLLFCPTCARGDSGAGAFDARGDLRGIVVSKNVMTAPSAQTGKEITVTAFEVETPAAIRSFLRSGT